MRSIRIAGALLVVGALFAAPAAAVAQAQARALVDGREWQRSSAEQRRAYLIGISNAISVGARYDAKHATAGSDTFALQAQKRFAGAELDRAVERLDAWYKAHPTELEKPVLSVIWRDLGGQAAK